MQLRTLPAAVPTLAGGGARGSLVAHEIQVVDFGRLQIAYDARVLQPRAWTTAQAQWAAEILPGLPPRPVLDICAAVEELTAGRLEPGDRRVYPGQGVLLRLDRSSH